MKKTKKNPESRIQNPEGKRNGQIKYADVASLSQVERICSEPLEVKLMLRGEPLRFVGRRLFTAEQKRLQAIMERALPPELPAEKPGEEPRYDLRSEAFRKQSRDDRRMARAIALHLAFPVLAMPPRQIVTGANASPQPVNPSDKEIADYMDGLKLDEELLDYLFAQLLDSIIRVEQLAERVNFT